MCVPSYSNQPFEYRVAKRNTKMNITTIIMAATGKINVGGKRCSQKDSNISPYATVFDFRIKLLNYDEC